jgi:hypothetical protein
MNIFTKKTVLVISLSIAGFSTFAQDMLSMLDSANTKKTHEKVVTTFKGSKIINAQTTETVKARTMDFSITHRFGNIGVASNGGGHTLYGLDNISDVRFGFDFGLTNNITLGIGRSKSNELVDGFLKYRICTQTQDNHIPFSLALYADASYNPSAATTFYNGMGTPDSTWKQSEIHRFSYTTQLILARKFGWRFSMELLPTYQHRNFVLANINPDNGYSETNDLFSLGGGFRFKFTPRFAFICDYFYTFSKYRTGNSSTPYYAPLAVGFEIETGGHVFHLTFTNSAGIIENNFLPNTTDNWLKGGFKFGFNISRVFNVGKPKKETK